MNWNATAPAFWAGILALDITGVGPFMISQPIVCGPLFGFLQGHMMLGVLAGAIVQLLWMDVTPVGVGIPFDSTAVTLLTVYWASQMPGAPMGVVALMLILAVPAGILFRFVDQKARRINTQLGRIIEQASDARLSLALIFGTFVGLLWNWVRYTALYFVVMLAGDLVWRRLPGWAPGMWNMLIRSMDIAIILLPVAGIGVVLEYFLSEEPERKWTRVLRQKPPTAGML